MTGLALRSGCIRAAHRVGRASGTRSKREYSSKVTSQSNINDESRRLLRALLRECSYLPDSQARVRIKHHIISRFERRKRNNTKIFERRDLLQPNEADALPPAANQLIQNGLKKGYKTLRQLQAANNGQIAQLDKVLRLAYGRTGSYRRDLLAPLLHPDPVADSDALGQLIKQLQEPAKSVWTIETVPVDSIFQQPPMIENDTAIYDISPAYSKFKALVESQVQAHPPEMRSVALKGASFKMFTKNTWDRLVPRKRVKNTVHRAYANLLDKILPPLSEKEWKRLHGLVHGTVKGEGMVPRRKKIAVKPGILTSYDLEKLAHLDVGQGNTLSTIDRPDSTSPDQDAWLNNADAVEAAKEDLLRDELSLGRPLNKHAKGKAAGHQITPRLMQGLWQRIFEACPMLTWNEKENTWQVTSKRYGVLLLERNRGIRL
jgi:hypothetical protein